MIRKIKGIWNRSILRPFIYMTATRAGSGLLFALLLDFFIKDPRRNIKSYACLFLSIFFLCLAWIAWLRLDQFHLPKLMMKRWNPKKKPFRTYGDMIDHIDEPITSFDELETDEKDVCCMLADAVCVVLFLILCLTNS